MASSGLKKMLFFILSNIEGVRVLVCPAILGHWFGFCGRCSNHQAGVMPIYWLMLANCCFAYGRCYCHSFLWQILLPLLCILLADVIARSLLADVIAIVGMLLGWWQMLLELWPLLLPLVGMMYHSMADVIVIFVG